MLKVATLKSRKSYLQVEIILKFPIFAHLSKFKATCKVLSATHLNIFKPIAYSILGNKIHSLAVLLPFRPPRTKLQVTREMPRVSNLTHHVPLPFTFALHASIHASPTNCARNNFCQFWHAENEACKMTPRLLKFFSWRFFLSKLSHCNLHVHGTSVVLHGTSGCIVCVWTRCILNRAYSGRGGGARFRWGWCRAATDNQCLMDKMGHCRYIKCMTPID